MRKPYRYKKTGAQAPGKKGLLSQIRQPLCCTCTKKKLPSPPTWTPYMDASWSASVGVVMVQSGASSLTSGLFVQALDLLAMVAFAGAVPICVAGLMPTGASGVSAPRLCLLVPSRCFFHALLETVFCKGLLGLSGEVARVVFQMRFALVRQQRPCLRTGSICLLQMARRA